MRTLLLGSGGRESALAWALDLSSEVSELVCAPGNPGIARYAETLPADLTDPDEVVSLARRLDSDLVVVGPEAPLVAGVGDALRADGRLVFGPDSKAALIEGSKAYAKGLMDSVSIPTARWRAVTSVAEGLDFMDHLGAPYVVKADGLAAGKGVVVTPSRAEAKLALEECLVARRFGEAGGRVVVEEYLEGEEISLIALSDGRSVVACEPAQDHKRAFDGDAGPNTGGMGSYSPVPVCPAELAEEIIADVVQPMIAATAAAGAPLVGAIYAGLVLTDRGPRVLEFNCRFGDPETQAILPRLRSDLGVALLACARGELAGLELEWSDEACVSIVLASGGYPGAYVTGLPIEGVEQAGDLDGVDVFHSGTALEDGGLVTAGGRVLSVSACGRFFEEARALAYEAAGLIEFEGRHMRSDIGPGTAPPEVVDVMTESAHGRSR